MDAPVPEVQVTQAVQFFLYNSGSGLVCTSTMIERDWLIPTAVIAFGLGIAFTAVVIEQFAKR
jgi:hypothetical protein